MVVGYDWGKPSQLLRCISATWLNTKHHRLQVSALTPLRLPSSRNTTSIAGKGDGSTLKRQNTRRKLPPSKRTGTNRPMMRRVKGLMSSARRKPNIIAKYRRTARSGKPGRQASTRDTTSSLPTPTSCASFLLSISNLISTQTRISRLPTLCRRSSSTAISQALVGYFGRV